MTSDIDLWTGTYEDTDDGNWAVYTYKDDAVQFIHTDTHAQVWNGRTVVSDEFPSGRLEAHYSESTGYIFLVAATAHNRPPEYDTLYDTGDLEFDPAELDDTTLELVLQTFLAEWTDELAITTPDYPGSSSLDTLTDLTTGDISAAKETPFDERTTQEVFNVAVATIATRHNHV